MQLTSRTRKIGPIHAAANRARLDVLVQLADDLDATEHKLLAQLTAVHTQLQVVIDLAQELAAMVRQRQTGEAGPLFY
ncbi:MAG TPA: hypothetical protein VNK95_06955, partial [Caldilineaceae bacterium]|nr:hypothetical protein [Caldilineaceae bacterium]